MTARGTAEPSPVDLVIFTPTATEYSVACTYLEASKRLDSETYQTTIGTLAGYMVVVTMPAEMGGYAASEAGRRLVERWNPRWFAIVGIAGGYHAKGVKVGDAVIASRVYPYEFAKVHVDGTFERRDRYDIEPVSWVNSAKVLEEEQHEAQIEWAQRVRVQRPDRQPVTTSRIYVGPMASGEKLLDDPTYASFQDAIKLLPDLYGIEMEAAGVGAALRGLNTERDTNIGFLMIRGISDVPLPPEDRPLVALGANSERDDWKRYAAGLAIGVLDHLLRSRRPPSSERESAFAEVGSNTTRPRRAPSLGRLPIGSSVFVGRDDELGFLDEAWRHENVHVLVIKAWGGVGKSALTNRWLQRIQANHEVSASNIFVWSFYSQGADRTGTADLFVAHMLSQFGDDDPPDSPWDRGERLAMRLTSDRNLLVLDGLEPLQHAPGAQEGRLKDQSLQALLRSLAASNPGLCVISSRLAVADLQDFAAPAVTMLSLEHLDTKSGAQLLRQLDVHGTDAELEAAAHEYGGHCLALTLLGMYVREAYEGNISRRHEIPALETEERYGSHAIRVLAAYDHWFQGRPEGNILRLVGLFDGPASSGALEAARSGPPLPRLTDLLANISDAAWNTAIANLERVGLMVRVPGLLGSHLLDVHPLVREHFGALLQQENIASWQTGHERLYRFFAESTPHLPSTVEEMAPLFRSVVHGCRAGLHEQVLLDVYQPRIQRAPDAYNSRKLGGAEVELAVLPAFFDAPWTSPVSGLQADAKSYVLNEAGNVLKSTGRVADAAAPLLAAIEIDSRTKNWAAATTSAANLDDVYLTLGRLHEALSYTRQSRRWASPNRADVPALVLDARAREGRVLHQLGRLADARRAFGQAEEWLPELDPGHPVLYSTLGYAYCDLLLDDGRHELVAQRALTMLGWANETLDLLDTALAHLIYGRALITARSADLSQLSEARAHFDKAVEELRRSGHQDRLPEALIGRAELRRWVGDAPRAREDLAEALRIADRGAMALYRVDCMLGFVRTLLNEEPDKAAEYLQRAKAEADECRYGRRRNDIKALQRSLASGDR